MRTSRHFRGTGRFKNKDAPSVAGRGGGRPVAAEQKTEEAGLGGGGVDGQRRQLVALLRGTLLAVRALPRVAGDALAARWSGERAVSIRYEKFMKIY